MIISDSTAKALDFFNKHSKKIIITFVVLTSIALFAAVAAPWFYPKADNNVLALLDGENITTTDLNKFAFGIVMRGTPENPDLEGSGLDSEVILRKLIESKIIKKEAIVLNITAEEENVKKYILGSYNDFDLESSLYEQIYQYQEYLYLKEKISTKVNGVREGKFVIARDDVYQPDPARAINAADQINIDKNIAYTKIFIEDIYQKLLDKSITFDQAISLELNDSFIGENVISENGSLHSGLFDSDDFAMKTSVLSHDEVYQAVAKLKKGEMTKPIYLSTNINEKDVSIGWVIATLTTTNNEGGISYENWYQDKHGQHEVVYGGVK
jgi:hypothetical protein